MSHSSRRSRTHSGNIAAPFLFHRCSRSNGFLAAASDVVVARMPTHHLEQEHCPLNPTLLVAIIKTIQYTSLGSMVPYVRLPPNAPDYINYVLNAGAGGIVQPHVQNAEQARRLVDCAKFPPLGTRSYPPMALFGRQTRTRPEKTVYDVWNEHAAVFAQIEDVEGVENVEKIAAVPGSEWLTLLQSCYAARDVVWSANKWVFS